MLELLDASCSRSRFSLDCEVASIPITLASETDVDMCFVRIDPGIWTPLPSSDLRCYATLMDDVFDSLVSGFGCFDDG